MADAAVRIPVEETKPAPVPLLTVQSFVNTWEADSGVDLLVDQDIGDRWLQQAGLIEAPGVDLAAVRRIREAIRGLLVVNSGEAPLEPGDVGVLRELAHDARFGAVVRADGQVDLVPASVDGVSPLVGQLLLIIRDAQRDGSWSRLKACRNPDCRWAYYDRSHAGRGAWCDMAVCGNRIKNRNLRTRRSAAPA